MPTITYTDEDIKNAKINLANQKLTSFQSAILFQHIDNLQQRIDKAIEYIKEFRFATTDFSLHSDRLLSILQDEEVKDNEV